MARPSSSESRISSCRIWACTITSSAVVGSSASSTRGWQASAIAIAARCRIPPENSCGKRRARSARMPTSSSSSPQRACAALPRATPWSSIASTIWWPMRCTGLNAFIAPWKTIAMSFQRCGRTESSPRARMSSPSSSTRPATLALGGSRPISARLSVVLPQPDSPTSPMRCPRSSVKPEPCTACSSRPPPRSNQTCRSCTSSTGALTRPPRGRGRGASGTGAPRGGSRAGAG